MGSLAASVSIRSLSSSVWASVAMCYNTKMDSKQEHGSIDAAKARVEAAWVAIGGGKSFAELPALPQMYVKMRGGLVRPVWQALMAITIGSVAIFAWLKPAPTPVILVLVAGMMISMILLPINWLRARARWFELKDRVEANEHLNCPSCAHDLRGTVLQSGDKVIQSPAESEADDAVWCPNCGDGYRVKELPGFWNLPVQWFC